MSSFLFLHFCDDALRLLGLYFSAVPLSNPIFRWLLPVPYKPPQEPHAGPTGLVWGCTGVVSLPRPLTGHESPHRGESCFSPQNELTPPPKGGGAGFCSSLGFRVLLGSCLWQPLATTGSHGPNRAGLLLRWCRSPTPPFDRPKIAVQGRVWFHRLFFLAFLGGGPASWRCRW